MKQKILFLLSMFVMSLTAMGQTPVQPSGSGTEDDPYRIGTVEEFLYIVQNNFYNSYYCELTNDIDLSPVCHPADEANGISEANWMDIGFNQYGFKGNLDGQGYAIKNLYIREKEGVLSYGLFPKISSSIKNLKLLDVDISIDVNGANSYNYVGGFGGVSSYSSHFENCSVSGTIIVNNESGNSDKNTMSMIGGIVGYPNHSSFTYCANEATITSYNKYGGDDVGGIAGRASGLVTRCTNKGNITAQTGASNVLTAEGGIFGRVIYESISMTDCLNEGMITGLQAGGLIGSVSLDKNNKAIIKSCLNKGIIVCSSNKSYASVGHIIGSMSSSGNNDNETWVVGPSARLIKDGVFVDNPTGDPYIYPTKAEMKSGAATFALQNSRDSLCWKQVLGTDEEPMINDDIDSWEGLVVADETVDCRGVHAKLSDSYKNATSYSQVYIPHQRVDDYCTVCGDVIAPEYVSGHYVIKSAGNLIWFRDKYNNSRTELKSNNAELTANIDLSVWNEYNPEGWEGIGTSIPYSGTFNGNGFTIKNLYYNNSKDTGHNGGLFKTMLSATITDLKIIGNSTCSSSGLLAYSAAMCNISKCYVKGSLTCSAEAAGGLVANANETNFDYCASYVDVTGTSCVGGLIGKVSTASDGNGLFYCASYGTLKGTSNVGGLIGSSSDDGITNSVCYAPHASGFEGYYYTADGTKVEQTKEQMNDGTTLTAMNDNNWFQDPADVAPALGVVEGFKHYQVNCKGEEINEGLLAYFTRDDSEVRFYNGDGHRHIDGFCEFCGDVVKNEKGEFLISNAAELSWFRDKVNSGSRDINAVQTADIDLSGVCHSGNINAGVIEKSWEQVGMFYGTYDGGNHKITGLYQNTTSNKAGLFAQLGFYGNATLNAKAKIQNLSVEGNITVNATTMGTDGASIIVTCNMGTVDNCKSYGTITTNRTTAGGITADNYGGTIKNCINYASIATTQVKAGGVAGCSSGQITRCLNYGSVTSSVTKNSVYYYGGIVGYCTTTDTQFDNAISYCANYGEIKVPYVAGGICGYYKGTLPIVSCYNMANVASTIERGSLSLATFQTQRRTVVPVVSKNINSATIEKCCYHTGYTSMLSSDNGYTDEQFKQGKVAYILGTPWGQELGTDEYPVLDASQVYEHYPMACNGEEYQFPGVEPYYHNSVAGNGEKYHGDGHYYVDGNCIGGHGHLEPQQDAEGYYLIADLSNLLWFRENFNAIAGGFKARQTADIDLSGYCHAADEATGVAEANWTPLFSKMQAGSYGTYDGQGHEITGLYLNFIESGDYPSFFGYAGFNGATPADGRYTYIKNLTITGDVRGKYNTAIFASEGCLAKFENCRSKGSVTAEYDETISQCYVAGICGKIKGANASFVDCHNEATITATNNSTLNASRGFIAGVAGSGVMSRCTNSGAITATGNSYVGGVVCTTVGSLFGEEVEHSMEYCSNTGDINTICNTTNGVSYAGALIGRVNASATVYSCWSSADVVQDATAIPAQAKLIYSGLYASRNTDYTANFEKCYYNSDKLVATSSVSTGKTTAQFASGEVTYLLGRPWGQAIDKGTRENNPVLNSYKVFLTDGVYTNHVSIGKLAQEIDKLIDGHSTTTEVEEIIDSILER